MIEVDSGPPISGLVFTKNAERYLDLCLSSMLPICSELVVVDMSSTDATRDIARRLGARLVTAPDAGYVEPVRQMGVDECRGPWILNLDADEVLHPALAAHLVVIARESTWDAIDLPYRNFLLGAPLIGTGWASHQDHHIRFYRASALNHSPTLHEPSVVRPGYRTLRILPGLGEIWHFNYASTRDFVERLNRYTELEANTIGDVRASKRFVSPVREFLRRYFYLGGWKDGWRGWELSLLMAFYKYLAAAKRRERDRVGRESDVIARYRQDAASLLANGYDSL